MTENKEISNKINCTEREENTRGEKEREKYPTDNKLCSSCDTANVNRILKIRRYTQIRQADLVRLRVSLPKVQAFLMTADHNPSRYLLDSDALRGRFVKKPAQLELFSTDEMR